MIVILEDSDVEELVRGEVVQIQIGGNCVIGLATNKFLEKDEQEDD